jgi:hypothetical protein
MKLEKLKKVGLSAAATAVVLLDAAAMVAL